MANNVGCAYCAYPCIFYTHSLVGEGVEGSTVVSLHQTVQPDISPTLAFFKYICMLQVSISAELSMKRWNKLRNQFMFYEKHISYEWHIYINYALNMCMYIYHVYCTQTICTLHA